jgi:hypothetical protein
VAVLSAQERRRRVVELREQGITYREIGRVLGVSHEQARRDARAAGVTTVTAVPDGLGPRGHAFWSDALDAFELDRHEEELLTQVCRLLDRLDALRAAVDDDGVMLDMRVHPAVSAERQLSVALGRLLAQLEIPSEAETSLRSPTSVRASRAARTRWDRTIAQRGVVARRRVDAPTLDERRRLAQAARLRRNARARYRPLRLAMERGHALSPEEHAEDALVCADVVARADELDPLHLTDDPVMQWRILRAWNESRPAGEPPI